MPFGFNNFHQYVTVFYDANLKISYLDPPLSNDPFFFLYKKYLQPPTPFQHKLIIIPSPTYNCTILLFLFLETSCGLKRRMYHVHGIPGSLPYGNIPTCRVFLYNHQYVSPYNNSINNRKNPITTPGVNWLSSFLLFKLTI